MHSPRLAVFALACTACRMLYHTSEQGDEASSRASTEAALTTGALTTAVQTSSESSTSDVHSTQTSVEVPSETSWTATGTDTSSATTALDTSDASTTGGPAEHEGLYVFVTSTTFPSNLGGVAGAHQACQKAAINFDPEHHKHYRAWLSANVGHNSYTPAGSFNRDCRRPYILPSEDHPVVADDFEDLTDGSLKSAINVTEFKVELKNNEERLVWTRTLPSGDVVPSYTNTTFCVNVNSDCGDWDHHWPNKDCGGGGNFSAANSYTVAGRAQEGYTFFSWTSDTFARCDSNLRIYCFEQCPSDPP
jgi:hypothetical protein